MAPVPTDLQALLDAAGVPSLRLWAVGWAKVAPAIALVPAFGLRGLPGAARVALGLALAASAVPLVSAGGAFAGYASMASAAVSGTAVALVASSSIWVANMAGGLIDDLRGASQETSRLAVVPAGTTPLGALFGLVASIAYLVSGGPARLVSAMNRTSGLSLGTWVEVAATLTSGIELAVSVVAPVVGAALVFEVAAALIARAASPSSIHASIGMCRNLVLLLLLALVTERVFELIVRIAGRG
jgi:type III secretory pathway component EscT